MAVFAECSCQSPCSITSAFSFSSSTTARRTVQTLIGSYVAFRTSTRPPIAVVGDEASGPWRGCPVGVTDPTGAGGTLLSISAPESSGALPFPGQSRGPPRRRRAAVRVACGQVGAEHPHLLAQRAQSGDRLGDWALVRVAAGVRERHVAAKAPAARPRL